MEEVQKWPIDFDQVKQGDVFNPDQLADIVGVPRKSRRYPGRIMAFQKALEDELWERGKPWTFLIQKDSILVLSDAEASVRNHQRFKGHVRGLARDNLRMSAVDRGKLPANDLRKHDRALITQAAVIAGIVGAGTQLRPIPNRRRNPGLENFG
jgi:alkylated DNA nucleotide flippase Atl1